MARRHADRPLQRAPGAGRPRKSARTSTRPVPEEILATAARLFAGQGVAATTMAEIAEAVGLGVTSLYYYFGSKRAILEQLIDDVNRVPLANLRRINAAGGPVAQRLHRLIELDVVTLCEFPFDINEVHRLSGDGDSEAVFEAYWRDRQELNDAVEALIDEGISTGVFVGDDARFVALTVLATNEAVQNWYRPVGSRRLRHRDPEAGGDYTPAEIGIRTADLALRGLLREPDDLPAIRLGAREI